MENMEKVINADGERNDENLEDYLKNSCFEEFKIEKKTHNQKVRKSNIGDIIMNSIAGSRNKKITRVSP